MAEAIVLYFGAAALAAVIIGISFRLARRYPSPYLSFNVYHLTLFCLGFFASRPIPRMITLALHLTDRQSMFLSAINLTFIMQPLIVFVLYLQVRFAAAWLEFKITKTLNALYFSLQGAYALALGLAIFGYLDAGKASPAASFLLRSRDGIFTIFDFSVFVWLMLGSRRLADSGKRRGVALYGGLGLAGLAAYNLASLAGLSGPAQPLLLLAQVLPALFFLNSFVRKEWRQRPAPSDAAMAWMAASYGITAREREIARLIGRGLSNAEIASDLFLSPQTVKNQIHVLFGKLNVRNRVELTNIFGQAEARSPAEGGSPSGRADGA